MAGCFYCHTPCAEVCCGCGSVAYCSPQHLAIHRPGQYCLPFQVMQLDVDFLG